MEFTEGRYELPDPHLSGRPETGNRRLVLHFGDTPGVEHPDCDYRGQVSPELDCWFCSHCCAQGRMSGAWFMDLLNRHAVKVGEP